MAKKSTASANQMKISAVSLLLMCLLSLGLSTSCDLFTPAATFTATYDGNGHTGGSVPTDSNDYKEGMAVTVLGNTSSLVKTDYTFAGWNTASDGTGIDRTPDSTFTMGTADVTLYAKWAPSIVGEWLTNQTFLIYDDATPPAATLSVTQNITMIMAADETFTYSGTSTITSSPQTAVEGNGTYVYNAGAGTLTLTYLASLMDGTEADYPARTYLCEITITTMTLSTETVVMWGQAEPLVYTRQ